MSWDFEFSAGDMTGKTVTGDNEVLQRVHARLERELGEWFLNTDSGLPWYQNGKGILGSNIRNKSIVDQLIRKRVLDTDGVSRVVSFNAVFSSDTREYSIYMLLVLESGEQAEATLSVTNKGVSATWHQKNMA